MDASKRHNDPRLTPETFARARQVFLGEGEKLRDPGPDSLRRARGDAMLWMGYAFHLFIHSRHDIAPFFREPPPDEEPHERKIRLQGEWIELGTAWFSLALKPGFEMPDTMLGSIPYLRREVWRRRSEPSVLGEFYASIRRRKYHARKKGENPSHVATDLYEKITASVHSERAIRLQDDAIESLDMQDTVGRWMVGLPPREREALERLLDDLPDRDAADRQARSRAQRRLRAMRDAEQEQR